MDLLGKNVNRAITNPSILLVLIIFSNGFLCIDIKNVAERLSQDLHGLKNEEMGVPFVQQLSKSFKQSPNTLDINKTLKKMVTKLETKLEEAFSALLNTKRIIEDVSNISNLPSTLIPCLRGNVEKDMDAFTMLNNGLFSEINETLKPFEMGYELQKMRRNAGSIKNAIKQQYFISNKDVRSLTHSPFAECTGHDDSVLWDRYMERNVYSRRNLILLLDHGGTLSKKQLQIVKSLAKQMIAVLEKSDRVALIGISSDWFSPASQSECLIPNQVPKEATELPELKPAEFPHKYTLYNFIDSLTRGNGATNHSLGIDKALEVVIKNSEMLKDETVMILYISRGLLSWLTEARTVLESIAKLTDQLSLAVIINTCAVIDESKPIMYETHFLRDIAAQNYNKYNITYKNNVFRKIGSMLAVNSSEGVGFAVSQFFDTFNTNSSFNFNKKISFPTWDYISNDLTVSLSIGWLSEDNFSILGADIYFSNFAEDVAHFKSSQQSYAFLIDLNGYVLIHPNLAKPKNNQLAFVDVSLLEKIPEIEALRSRLLKDSSGQFITNATRQYTWMRVADWYVICIVQESKSSLPSNSQRGKWSNALSHHLVYKNLTRSENYKLCRHLNVVATTDASSLYLSSSCFQSPYNASHTSQDKFQGYLAYLKDETRLLANPGLKDDIRDEVALLAHVLDFFRNKHLTSILSKYIVRRYAASYSGVLQMYPGSILHSSFEPTKRPWFTKAVEHKGKVAFTSPYLDGAGAGYIVTVSFATPQVVVAMDLTYNYMFKAVAEYIPACLNSSVTCFLMDDQGYLVYHENLMDIDASRPVEQQHMIHKESLVANDILSHRNFVQKLLCNNYGESTIQRFYKLNISFTGVLSNFVIGENCVSYKITSVLDTNVFIGVVKTTCKAGPHFCPCSVVDRLCLNCNRMEQKECECPCECPLNIDTEICKNINTNITNNVPCTYPNQGSTEAVFEDDDSELESCFHIDCQSESSQLECLGLIGCEWCRKDVYGNFLAKPFCTNINSCFNGIFGAISPYGSAIGGSMSSDPEYSPIGPILGSVIGMCALFILLFVFYKTYTTPTTERLYLSSTQDNQLRMSDLNVNDNFHDLGNHRDKLLQEDRLDPISPYCVASTYRRAAPAADSDHGYSTMTPHDESEHLSLAPVEVDSLEDDLTDNASVHTSVSAKHNSTSPPMFTRLPNKIIVPVTVHRNMEAT